MDKLQNMDWRGMYKSATNKVKKYAMNLSELEIKVEDATGAEPWGPHGSAMKEIAESSFDSESYQQIMGVVARRLKETGENWRMCYKALLLLEYMIKHGPIRVARDVESSGAVMDRLQNFQFKDPNGRDHGVNVRHRAKEIAELVSSPENLERERLKAASLKNKYGGVSRQDMSGGGSGFGVRSGGGSRPSTERPNIASSMGFGSARAGAAGGGGGRGSAGGGAFSGGSGGFSGGGFGGANSAFRGRDDFDGFEQDAAAFDSPAKAESDAHYISKRRGADAEALTATRDRIERLRLNESGARDTDPSKKKLTDVKVNERIAKSLGFAPPPRSPAQAAPAGESSQGSATEADLLAELSGPAPAAPTSGWDAFGGGGGGTVAPPSNLLLGDDLLGGPALLGESPVPPPGADPFARVIRAEATAQPQKKALARSPAPEDAFADLAGIPHGSAALNALGAAAPRSPMRQHSGKSTPTFAGGQGPAVGRLGSGGGALPADLFAAPPAPLAAGVDEFGTMLSAGGYAGNRTVATGKDPFADLLK